MTELLTRSFEHDNATDAADAAPFDTSDILAPVLPEQGSAGFVVDGADDDLNGSDVRRFDHMDRFGPDLAKRGWPILPIMPASKAPGFGPPGEYPLRDWTHYAGNEPLPNFIELWSRMGAGIGLACGGKRGGVVAVDIDTSAEHTAALRELATQMLGKSSFVRKRGERLALLYRSDAPPPSTSVAGVVDLLSTGRQIFALGWHPSGAEYEWPEIELQDSYPNDLPTIDASALDAFMRAVHDYAVANGIVTQRAPPKSGTTPRPTIARGPAQTVDAAALDAVLSVLPNDGDWNEWTTVAMAVHNSGGTFELFDTWSARSGKYDAAATAKRWATVASNRGEVRFGTLVHMLQQRGITVPPVARTADNDDAFDVDLTAYADALDDAAEAAAVEAAQNIWTDKHGRSWHGLTRLTSSSTPATALSRIPIDELRALAATRIAGFDQRADDFHARPATPITKDTLFNAKYRQIFIPGSVRQINQEETGAAKSTGFVLRMAARVADPDWSNWNRLYVAKNGKMAAQMAADLRKAGVPVINVRGAGKLCGNADLKPRIAALASQGMPSDDTCKTCPMFSTCAYQAQRVPVRGHVVIAQIAHVKLDVILPLDAKSDDGTPASAPIHSTYFDESLLAEMHVSTRFAADALRKPPVVPTSKLRARQYETEHERAARQSTADAEAVADTTRLAEIFATVRALVDGVTVYPPLAGQKNREHVPMAAITAAGMFDRWAGVGPSVVDDMLRDLCAIKHRFYGALIEQTKLKLKGDGFVDLRGKAGAGYRVIQAVEVVLVAIAENADRSDALSTVFVEVVGKARTRGVRANYLGKIPSRVKVAPICFMDATADLWVIEALLREQTQRKPPFWEGDAVWTESNAFHHDWRVHTGRATTPFAVHRKIVGAPVKAGALTRRRQQIEPPKGNVSLSGVDFVNGQRSKPGKAPTIDLPGMRRDAAARQVERYLMVAVAQHDRDGWQRSDIGIIAPKQVADAFKGRAWAAGLLIGHHGAVAGLNTWKDCKVLYVVGQQRPDAWAVEDLACAVAAAHPARPAIATSGRYVTGSTPITIDGQTLSMDAPGFNDPWVHSVLMQLQDAQSEQVYGRLRSNNRQMAAEACTLIAIDQVPGGNWADAEVFAAPTELDVFVARHGREPATAAEAFAMAPDVFVSARQARHALAGLQVNQAVSPVSGGGLNGWDNNFGAAISAYSDPDASLPIYYKPISPLTSNIVPTDHADPLTDQRIQPPNTNEPMVKARAGSLLHGLPLAEFQAMAAAADYDPKRMVGALAAIGRVGSFNTVVKAIRRALKAHGLLRHGRADATNL